MGLTAITEIGFNEVTGTGTLLDPYILNNTASDNLNFQATTDVAGRIYYSYYGPAANYGIFIAQLNHPPNVDWYATSYNPSLPSICDFSGSYYVEPGLAVSMYRVGASPIGMPYVWGSWTASIWFVPDTLVSNVYAVTANVVSMFDRNIATGSLASNGTTDPYGDPKEICISYDGKSVYVTSYSAGELLIFSRNTSTGVLSRITQVSTGYSPSAVAISRDGKNVYVANKDSNSISIFDRNLTTGLLSGTSTIASTLAPQGICISPDGKNVYTTNPYISLSVIFGVVSIYNRNTSTGELTFYGQILTGYGDGVTATNPKGICVSEDGENVYVCNSSTNEISEFNRNILTGALTLIAEPVHTIAAGEVPTNICISQDGKNIYVANNGGSIPGYNYISIFDRNLTTGILSGTSTIQAQANPYGICISGDDKNVYVTNSGANTISVFDRNVSTGELSSNSFDITGVTPLGICVYPLLFQPISSTALLIDVQPSGVVSEVPFTIQPIIKIVDLNGDVVPTATNDVSVSITVVNGSGLLTGTTTVTAVDGYATFTDLVFTGAGSFYLTFNSIDLTPVNSNEIATLTPTELIVSVQPFAGLSGEILFTQPTIAIVNWIGDLVIDATDVVDVSLVDVTGSSVLTGTLNAIAFGGYAAFTDLIATGYGSFYLSFTSGTLTSVNSNILFFIPDPGSPNPAIPVKPKRSYIPASVPTSVDMETNEFAINVADKKGYVRDSNGIVHQVFDGNASGSGTVTSVGLSSTNSTLTISNSPVTTSGTIKIDLSKTSVSAKAYTNADITVDAYGRITAASDGAVGVTSIIAGTGISVDAATGDVTVTNSAPDQVVVLTNGTAISVTGTYPDFTITNDSPDQIVTLTDGTAISVTGTYPDFTITNSLPDQTVTLTQGTDITITGTYPDFTIGYSGVAGGVTSIISGTGISIDVSTGDVTITNSAPDQIVSITSGTGINATGIYPDFTIDSTITQYTDSDARLALSAGTGISYDNATGIITNSEPDQIVALTGGTDISVTGTYPDFTIDFDGNTSYLPLSGGTMTGSITSFGTTHDTEVSGDFFGVQLSADHTQGTMVNFDGLDTYSGASHMKVNPTGLTFPDATTQTTAYTGGSGVSSITAGTGISVDTTTGAVTVTNDAPDQTVSLTDGTGISVTGTYPSFTITNSLPDQTVSLTQGTDITITGTYPSFTIAYSGTSSGVSSITAGTGISVDVTTGAVTVTNSSPDQTVTLTDGTGISVTGTYPSFTIATTITQYTDSDARLSLSAGTGISYDNATGVITNDAPDQTVSLTDGTDISITGTYPNFTISYTGTGSGGTVTSVDMSVPTGLLVSGNPITTTGTLAVTFDTGYSIPTTSSQTNWDTAYTQRLQWDGGATNLVAATGRTSLGATTIGSNLFTLPSPADIAFIRINLNNTVSTLSASTFRTSIGATTVGANLFTLTNPTAITFPRFNADNTVSALDAATFRTAIGAGTSSTTGTVTSIATTSPITGGTITGTGTIGINAASANTASFVVQRDASGNFSAGTITASLTGNATGLAASAALTTPTITGLIEKQTAPAIASGVLALNCASGNVFAVSLNAAITSITFSNIPTTGNAFGITLAFTADGTARTISWPASVKWSGGTAPTLTSTNAKVDIFVLTTWDGGTTWYAMIGGQNL